MEKIFFNPIGEGDWVTVVFGPNRFIVGQVMYKPVVTGDAWIIQDEAQTYYVQKFERIVK